ncbi:MAG: hypothetical protein ACYS9X_28980, partial [Planctomycetota bacterium]
QSMHACRIVSGITKHAEHVFHRVLLKSGPQISITGWVNGRLAFCRRNSKGHHRLEDSLPALLI